MALSAASAEPESPAISLDSLALELSNPVTALRQFDWQVQGTLFQGDLPDADGLSSMKNFFTPSWPFKLKNGNNLLLSLTIPVFSDQPLWELAWWDHTAEWRIRQRPEMYVDRGFWARGHDHLEDITVNLGYGGVSDKGTIGMIGLTTVIATNEDGTSERDQLLLGPEFVYGKITDWGLYAARFKHLTDVYEDDVPGGYGAEFPWSTNETTARIYVAYALGNGWQIESNPTILYD